MTDEDIKKATDNTAEWIGCSKSTAKSFIELCMTSDPIAVQNILLFRIVRALEKLTDGTSKDRYDYSGPSVR